MGVVKRSTLKRFDVYLINLDPTIGAEITKTRPCVIVSPNEMNQFLATVIVAPLTSRIRNYPMRVRCQFQNRVGEVVLDQLRTVDQNRLIKRLGTIDGQTQTSLLQTLQVMFAP
jgi:mRNA interferase MazF